MIDPYQRIYLQANKAAHDMPDHAHSVESADMHELAWFAGKHFFIDTYYRHSRRCQRRHCYGQYCLHA